MKPLSVQLESLARVRERSPGSLVLVPNDPNVRPYGDTPYVGMDSRPGSAATSTATLPKGLGPLDYVVVGTCA